MSEIGMSGYLRKEDMRLDHLKLRCREVISAQSEYLSANPYAERHPDPLTGAINALAVALKEIE